MLARIVKRLARRTVPRSSASVARAPTTTLVSTSIYAPRREPVPDHPDTKLVMDSWRLYREHRPELTWPDFIHALEMCRRAEAQMRARQEAELATLQSYTRFEP
jgi:hypothetical protein